VDTPWNGEGNPAVAVAEDTPTRRSLTKGQVTAVMVVVIAVAFVLISDGVAGSYDSLYHLAAAHHVPLPHLKPVDLDGGLIGIILLDITLTWVGYPLAWLRFSARLFAAGTIAANAAAGWPDPVAIFMRVFAPALIVLITEAVRAVLLDRVAEHRDPIPLTRWLLSPWATFRLWRRMVLWRIHSYSRAVAMELERRRAVVKLVTLYGKRWKKGAPADLVWMLRTGIHIEEALREIAELTPDSAPEPPGATSGGNRNRNRKRRGTRKPARNSAPRKPAGTPGGTTTGSASGGTSPPPDGNPAEDILSTEARALAILAAEPGISGSQLGIQLGKSDRYGRELIKRLVPAGAPAPAANEEGES
jgi:Protein of unknown function (DUF2637)